VLDDESITRIEALADMEVHRAALATALDCTEAAARTRVHRGLARLNHLMEATP
jgi:DNA-directed RNA polymerase specialized sigma24 family protein